MTTPAPGDVVRKFSTWSIVWAVLLIICGVLAIGSPEMAAIAVNVVLAWLIIFAGIVHVVIAFHAHRGGSFIWKLLVGIAYIVFGGYLLFNPVVGVASLTLVIAVLFLVEGVFDIILFFKMRSQRGAGWVLFDAIVTIILGLLIYVHWPSSSAWAIGTLVGVSMIISGWTRLMLSIAVREAATVPAH